MNVSDMRQMFELQRDGAMSCVETDAALMTVERLL